MRPKNLVGIMGVVAMAVLLSAPWAGAWDLTADSGDVVIVAGVLTFKTSPNVWVDYNADGTAAGDGTSTTYVATSAHDAGDRAYGVDPDYTGMYVQTIAVGAADTVAAPAADAGATGAFGAAGWTAK